MPNIRPNLDLAPSNVRLADMEQILVNMRFREARLKRALELVSSRYASILSDCESLRAAEQKPVYPDYR